MSADEDIGNFLGRVVLIVVIVVLVVIVLGIECFKHVTWR